MLHFLRSFLKKWCTTTLLVFLLFRLLPGVHIYGNPTWVGLLIFTAFLTLINMWIKPILRILTLPITILTLGLSSLVVNIGCMYVAAWATHWLPYGIVLPTGILSTSIQLASGGALFLIGLLISCM